MHPSDAIQYPIEALNEVARQIDRLRREVCTDDAKGQHDSMFASIAAQYQKIIYEIYKPQDELDGITYNIAENQVSDALNAWNKLVRQLYDEYYKDMAQALRDAATNIQEQDAALSLPPHRGNGPQPR